MLMLTPSILTHLLILQGWLQWRWRLSLEFAERCGDGLGQVKEEGEEGAIVIYEAQEMYLAEY